MCLGAILDCGLPGKELIEHLQLLHLQGWELIEEKTRHKDIAATDVQIIVTTPQPHRHLHDILTLINGSSLPAPVKEKAAGVFENLARAEGKVHGKAPEKVHFHETGAVDAIIDVVGTIVGLHLLDVDRVVASPLPMGRGWVNCAHGKLPLPAPATLYLLEGIPVYGINIEAELVTPTGAAIITTLGEEFGPFPAMKINRVGFGAGKKHLEHPNLLRLVLGEEKGDSIATGSCAVIETTIDDMNPEFFPDLQEHVFAAGAMEVFFAPVQMKKGRPGILFTALCPEDKINCVSAAIFRHSTTIGLRCSFQKRIVAHRYISNVVTPYGPVAVKWSTYRSPFEKEEVIYNAAPEYESCRQAARSASVPVKEVYAAAVAAALAKNPRQGS